MNPELPFHVFGQLVFVLFSASPLGLGIARGRTLPLFSYRGSSWERHAPGVFRNRTQSVCLVQAEKGRVEGGWSEVAGQSYAEGL